MIDLFRVDAPKMSSTEGGGKDGKGEENRAVAVQQDPKNVAELTNYIQNMLQQMQDRWVGGLFLLRLTCASRRFQTMSDQIISRIDDMGTRIDDLEHNINDLMAQVFKFHENTNFHKNMSATNLTKVNIAGGSERRPSSPGKQRPGRPQVILDLVISIIQHPNQTNCSYHPNRTNFYYHPHQSFCHLN